MLHFASLQISNYPGTKRSSYSLLPVVLKLVAIVLQYYQVYLQYSRGSTHMNIVLHILQSGYVMPHIKSQVLTFFEKIQIFCRAASENIWNPL